MSAVTVQDAVGRFLDDAEAAAHQGHSAKAQQLILLALDTRPGDADVLMRASLVRNTLAAVNGESGGDSMPGDTATERSRDRIRGRSSRRRQSSSDDDEDDFQPIPGFMGAAIDKKTTTPVMDIIPGLPVGSGDQSSSGSAGPAISMEDEEDGGWVALRPPVTVKTPTQVVPDDTPRPKKSAPKGLLYALWGVMGVAALAATLVIAAPGFVNSVINKATNPLAAASAALQAHDYPKAIERARSAMAHGADPMQGNLVLGEALLRTHSPEAAGVLAQDVAASVDSGSTWQTSMKLARLLMEAGDTVNASRAYYSAYIKSAPLSQFLEIARGQLLAGEIKLPAALLPELAARRDPAYLADSASITALFNQVQSGRR